MVFYRTCWQCDKGMNEGYLHQFLSGTFCSKECYCSFFNETEEEINESIDSYEVCWTQWTEEDAEE